MSNIVSRLQTVVSVDHKKMSRNLDMPTDIVYSTRRFCSANALLQACEKQLIKADIKILYLDSI